MHEDSNLGPFSLKLLNDCDILCLQEHWLLNVHLTDLNICDNFIVAGVSGMDSETFVCGRPFGGNAIFFRKSFSSLISVCHVSFRRFCALYFTMPDCLTLLLVCVYLPFDNGLYPGHFEFQETLDQLEGFIDSQDYDMLAVVGDFNVDFSRTDRCHTNVLLQFMHTNSLLPKNLDFADVQFTYKSDDGLRWIMY